MNALTLVVAVLCAAAPADDHFAKGVKALKAKNAAEAADQLEKCVQAAPERADCRWELGWAYYLDARWADVVQQWQEVKRLQPTHPECATWRPRPRLPRPARQRRPRCLPRVAAVKTCACARWVT